MALSGFGEPERSEGEAQKLINGRSSTRGGERRPFWRWPFGRIWAVAGREAHHGSFHGAFLMWWWYIVVMVDLGLSQMSPFPGLVTPLFCGFFYDELIASIDNAKLFIDVVQYQWKWNIHERHSKIQQLGAAIGRARARGVEVSVILNQESPRRHLTVINRVSGDRLAEMGCSVKHCRPGALLHTKLWIIDGLLTFVGSHNLSTRSLTANEETSVLIRSVDVARSFKNYFDRLWGV